MELLEQFAQGDLKAFETLFRQHQNEVFGWIVRIVRDRTTAEELTVETFWRIYRARAGFDPSRSFGAWARRIATNLALDHMKHTRTAAELPDEISGCDANDPAIERDTKEQIELAFSSLSPKLRVTATLALIEERPYEEIAESLGVPVGTVKSRVFKAVRILRKKLKQAGIEP